MSLKSWKLTGLAALVAAGTTLATMGTASAVTPSLSGLAVPGQIATTGNIVKTGVYIGVNPWWWGRPHYRYRRPGFVYFYNGRYYARPWWRMRRHRARVHHRRHVGWCLNHYRSYNPRTNLFLGYDGRYHPCRSPF